MGEAEELAESIAKALGTSLKHYMPVTRAEAVRVAQRWVDEREEDIRLAAFDASR